MDAKLQLTNYRLQQRIVYKTALMAFDCVRGQGAENLKQWLPRESLFSWRSRSTTMCKPPQRHDCAAYIDVAMRTTRFCSSATSAWNDLPHKLKDSDISRIELKAGLKTWLLERAYSWHLRTLFKRRYKNWRSDWSIDWLHHKIRHFDLPDERGLRLRSAASAAVSKTWRTPSRVHDEHSR